MVYSTGSNVRIRARAADITGVCAGLAQSLSASGEYWTTRGRALDTSLGNSELVLVCRAADPTGVLLLDVLDTGGHFYGNSICSNLVTKGWFDLS